MGKTASDQSNIDRSVAQSCATGILDGRACDRHTEASAARRAELKGE